MSITTVAICNRARLPDRRNSIIFDFEHEGFRYRATVSCFPDGRPGEVFLDTSKGGSALQANAECSAVLVSLLLQHGVDAGTIRHSISGPVAAALDLI